MNRLPTIPPPKLSNMPSASGRPKTAETQGILFAHNYPFSIDICNIIC